MAGRAAPSVELQGPGRRELTARERLNTRFEVFAINSDHSIWKAHKACDCDAAGLYVERVNRCTDFYICVRCGFEALSQVTQKKVVK